MNNADADRRTLIEIAISQGNEFVQELLRSTEGARIGTTKGDFRQNLAAAIDQGLITADALADWLDTIEGWGSQHAYVYVAPPGVTQDARWQELDFVRDRVTTAGYTQLWDARRHHELPGELTLATIRFADGTLSFTWQRGYEQEKRRPLLDKREMVDEEEILFKASSVGPKRLVARFVWLTNTGIAGIYIPRSTDYSDYEALRDRIRRELQPVVDLTTWTPIDIVRFIRQLDDMAGQLDGGRLRVKTKGTMFMGASSTVQIRSNAAAGSYHDDDRVRPVSRAAVDAGLPGGDGDFRLTRPDRPETHIRMLARDRSIIFWGQMEDQDILGCVSDILTL